jgi:1,4-dihydroxy-2-naphthoate octaprenyltransferase
MMIAQYALVTYLVLTGVFTPALLVVFFAVPLFLQVAAAFRQPKPAAPPAAYPPGIWPLWFVALAFVHNRRFGLLFLGGLTVDVLVHRVGLL